ncbi:ABC transporter ATP-binding protein [Xanthobacter sp. VNH20]|uniref:ABC transporter ATP-binding protein n=1 Tax=Xanthobacter sp. VNH20 TaxID=3156616 RepID=UPI0032B411C6
MTIAMATTTGASPTAPPPGTEGSPCAVSIKGIARVFAGIKALDHVSLDIRQGEFFSLLGPSGCGKTTLLRIIAGFEMPTDGDLHINGRSVLALEPYDRRTNMVFQHGALFPHLNVAQNIAFGLEMKRVAVAEVRKRVNEALELVRLGGYGERRIEQLSGGQRQRIALARALVNKPEVLLLDEPLSALDLQLRLQMQDELRRLQRETGGTFVFVTHDQGEAITMSDRLAVMQSGQVLQVGTPREVYERPARRFVAEFMGHSNFFHGTVIRAHAGRADVSCGGFDIGGRAPQDIQAGDEVLVALRFEKVELTPSSGPATLHDGTVVEEIYMGATVRRSVRIGDGITLVSEASNTQAAPDLGVGCQVHVGWAADAPSVLKD